MPQPRSTSRKPAAKKPAAKAAAKKPAAKKPAAKKPVARKPAARDALASRALRPLELVMLTRERIQEAFDEAVGRGQIQRRDAERLAQDLVRRGRRQADDLLADVEQLLGRGSRRARAQVGKAVDRAAKAPATDRVLREADRVRRSAGVGGSFPILGYDRLTAAQVTRRLSDLTAAQLRKVRDHERRHGNRRSVIAAIEKRLG